MENGEQKIFVWCDFTPPMDTAIMHGVQVASILRKELCLMHMTHRKAENREIAEARLRGIAGKIAPLLTGLQVHYVVLGRAIAPKPAHGRGLRCAGIGSP